MLACFRFVRFVFIGDQCERRSPRPRDSSTPPGFTTASQKQEGQQLPLTTICHGDVPFWPFQRGRLEYLCVGRPRRNPRCAALLPQWTSGTRVRKEKRKQHHKHTARNTTRVLAQAVQRSALVRRKHPSVERSRVPSDIFTTNTTLPGCWPTRHLRTFPFCCFTKCYNTQSLKEWSMVGLRPTPPKWASRNRMREWCAHLGVDTTQGRWACMSVWEDSAPFSVKASDSVFLLTWRLLTGCHPNRYWIFAVNKRRLCACACFGRHTMDAAFQGFGVVFQGSPFGALPTARPQGRAFRAKFVARRGGGTKLAHPRGVLRQDRRLGLAEARLLVRATTRAWLRSGGRHAGFLGGAEHLWTVLQQSVVDPRYAHRLGSDLILCTWLIWGSRNTSALTPAGSCSMLWAGGATVRRLRRVPCAPKSGIADMAAREDGLDRLHLNLIVRKFCAQNKPKLALKAADGRQFLPILLKMLHLFFLAGSPRESVMVGCVETLCDIYKEQKTWDTTASPPRIASLTCRVARVARHERRRGLVVHLPKAPQVRALVRVHTADAGQSAAPVVLRWVKVRSAWRSHWPSAGTRATSGNVCWNVTGSLSIEACQRSRNEARTKTHAHFLTTNGHAQAHEHFRTGNWTPTRTRTRTHTHPPTHTHTHTCAHMRFAHRVFPRLWLWWLWWCGVVWCGVVWCGVGWGGVG